MTFVREVCRQQGARDSVLFVGGHVFVSYAHGPDGEFVARLAAFLTAAGLPVWFDKEIITGDRWERVICHQIDTCGAFVVVMTPHAEASKWVSREFVQAERTHKPIFPILLKGEAFFRHGDIQYEDVVGGQMPAEAFVARLREVLDRRADSPTPPTLVKVTGVARRTLAGHGGEVFCVAWSPDGRHLAAGGHFGVRMWDYTTGSSLPVLLRRSPGFITALPLPRTALIANPYDGTFSLAWSSDGQHLATAGNAVRIWHPGTGTSVRSLRDLGNVFRLGSGFLSVAWSYDGQRVVAGGVGGAVRVWDAVTGRRLHSLKGHTGPVHAVAWSPDSRLATASSDHTARIWLPAKGVLVRTLTGHTGAVRSVAWSPNGDRLTTGGDDRTVRIWDAQGSLLRTLTHHAGSVSAVAWSPDGQLLASGGADTTCQVSDPESGEKLCTLTGHSGRVLSISWSHNGDHIATSSADHTVRVWEIMRNG